ncbi:hypothetical protein CC188_06860 [Campylobacter coli]|nr:hypothetical protein [Campylobacter coli]
MMRKALEKILNTLEKCCEETHQKNMSEYEIRRQLFNILSKNNPNNIKEYDISIPDYKKTKKIIEEIKEKEDFRQRDELFSDDEKWYLICKATLDLSSLCDNMNNIQYNAIAQCNIIFSECNISLSDKQSENNRIVKTNLYFYNCTFEKSLNLKNIIFEKTLTFNQCAFYNDLDIHQNQFLDHLVFINCSNEQNEKIISLDLQENEFEGYLFIKNCTIENISLWKNKFKNRCYFVDSKFGYEQDEDKAKLNFSNTHYEDEVYFNNSEFSSYADFHECKFDNIACFYGAKFYKAPNFSACYFKEQKAANLINVDIDKLDFKSVEKYIEDNYQDETYENKQEIIEEQRDNNCKLKCAKHLKDSFRVIKDVLITQNNTLEAQEWHKLELYAKEKENHINLNVKEREKNTDIFKNILIWFNCILLNVYRNTSDHHNDFLKILNFTIGMIALYGVFFYLLLEVYMYLDIIFIESFFRFKIIDYIYLCLFVLLTIIMFLYKNKKSIFAKSILFLIIYITFYIVYIKILNFINITYFREWFFYLLCYIIGIYIFYLAFIFFSKFKFINFIFKLCIYLAFLSIWILSSNFINPFTGVFSSDKLYESQFEKSLNDLNTSAIINLARISQNDFNLHLKDQNISFTELNSAKALIIANKENLLKLNDLNSNIAKEVLGEEYTHTINQDKIIENTIKSTSVLYGIILLLCIFSLQKTARKNSIVPS